MQIAGAIQGFIQLLSAGFLDKPPNSYPGFDGRITAFYVGSIAFI